MDKQLVGMLSQDLKSQYAGQRVYMLQNGFYNLENGEAISFEVLKTLKDQGLYTRIAGSQGGVEDVKSILPEKVDMHNPNNAINAVGERLCRISPTIDAPYAGELVFNSNIPKHYITENGHILNSATLKLLSTQNKLIRNELLFKTHNPYNASKDLTKKESLFSHMFLHRTFPLIIAILLIAAVVLWGIPYISKTIDEQNSKVNAAGNAAPTSNITIKNTTE